MAVQVTACVHVGEADRLPAPNWGTPVTEGITCSSNTPVAVAVFHCSDPCYRLLPTTCLKYIKTHSESVTPKCCAYYYLHKGLKSCEGLTVLYIQV